MPSFNLIDEPWIPCLFPGESTPRLLGLAETLGRAHEIQEIRDNSPIVTAALHRLLLAILHRNFGPESVEAWQSLYDAGRFDERKLSGYFAQWHGRFDLFHPERPFYQCSELKTDYARPVARLAPELASGNNPTLFDHTTEEGGVVFTPARASRAIVALQVFVVGGTESLEKGQDPKKYKYARGGPLVKAALFVVRGDTLFETLLLNLHHYSCAEEEPFACEGKDAPAWERQRGPLPGERYPTGYLDYLTWQSRRVLLVPEEEMGGRVVVRSAVRMKGEEIPEDWQQEGRETMVAFYKNPAGKKRNAAPWLPLRFRPERAIWRDSLALLESVGERRWRPRMLDWLVELPEATEGDRVLSADLLGLSTDQARVMLWRHERVPLPVAYLKEKELVDSLREALETAERVAGVLRDSVRALASELLSPAVAGQDRQRGPDRKRLQALVHALTPEPRYWSLLEVQFSAFLVALAHDRSTDDEGEIIYGAAELPRWRAEVSRAAERVFEQMINEMGTGARVLRAAAEVSGGFRRRLRAVVNGTKVAVEVEQQ